MVVVPGSASRNVPTSRSSMSPWKLRELISRRLRRTWQAETEPCRIQWSGFLTFFVPEMVEQLVKLPKTVSEDGVQQRTVEHTADIPVPQVVEELGGGRQVADRRENRRED